jgi:tRNA(Arg) A34 adenosine deaminase TadA
MVGVISLENSKMISRFLDVIEYNILPITKGAVKKGHNIFGAAVLRADDLSLVTLGTNMRSMVPTYHGEMVTIQNFFMDENHPDPGDTLFLATHEPCSMCLSALAWSGFRRIYFLFGYEETRDDFRMGEDLRILAEVFSSTVPSRNNSFFELIPIRGMSLDLPERGNFRERIGRIKDTYKTLAERVLPA